MKKKSPIRVGFFLALRDLKRANIWTTSLIVLVMSLTYFNMLLLGGLLLGLADGSIETLRESYTSDIFIVPAKGKSFIEKSSDVKAAVESFEQVSAYAPHLIHTATIDHGYQEKVRSTDLGESYSGQIVGINPKLTDQTLNLSQYIIEGHYLYPTDSEYVLLGQEMFELYQSGRPDFVSASLLKDVSIGSKVRLTIGGIQKEVFVRGIIASGNPAVDSRIYVTMPTLRSFLNTSSLDVDEIAVKVTPDSNVTQVKIALERVIDNPNVNVLTYEEAVPSSVEDIKLTFSILGDVVSIISLIIGAITIFIVIFVNAITRRKYIGILKGIGISVQSIRVSYIIQAMTYAFIGIFIGAVLTMGYLKPYFDIHPIQLPIAEGSLSITTSDLVGRAISLSITALVSGFVPAWLVTRQNTLDAILGR